jgi:hypothetical protein
MSELGNTRVGGKADAPYNPTHMDDLRQPEAEKRGFNDWWEDRTLPEKILAGIGFAILGIGLLALFGLVVMLLWNWLMPDLFGLKTVNYWQAWGLLALSTILFKGLGAGNSGGSTERKRKRELRRYMREGQIPARED